MLDVIALFERELRERGVAFEIDPESLRHRIEHNGAIILVSLDNLIRDARQDADDARIVGFVDTVLSTRRWPLSWVEARSGIYLALEPSDYDELPGIRQPLSDLVDRVPIYFDQERKSLTWIERSMIEKWGVTEADVLAEALSNLARCMDATKVSYDEIDGVRLGMLETALPFKSALLLAPNLKAVVEPDLGWPLYAVIPDRDFMFLWDARHVDFIGRVGFTVVKEFKNAPYPLSTEVFEVSDSGMAAIGAYPTE